MAGPVFFWVQYLLGIGHLQRALRIADALVERGLAVTLVSGGMPVPVLGRSRARIVQLPPIRARDATFALYDEAGAPLGEEVWAARRQALLAAFAETRPAVVILEGFPFARRAFRAELDPLVTAVHAARPRPHLLSSIRDILVARDDPERSRQIVARVKGEFERVLVHGDPKFILLEASFAAAPEIADRLVYTGYVAAHDEDATGESAGAEDETGGVVVSAGGGAAGEALLAAALGARAGGSFADLPWLFLTGPHLPEREFRALCDGAPPGVRVERFRSDIGRLLRGARLSVSQAGYNTVLDVLAAGVPAVFVPFAEGRETEQTRRAEALAARGLAEFVSGAELSPERLAAALARAPARGAKRLALDTDGARRSAEVIASLADQSAAATAS